MDTTPDFVPVDVDPAAALAPHDAALVVEHIADWISRNDRRVRRMEEAAGDRPRGLLDSADVIADLRRVRVTIERARDGETP